MKVKAVLVIILLFIIIFSALLWMEKKQEDPLHVTLQQQYVSQHVEKSAFPADHMLYWRKDTLWRFVNQSSDEIVDTFGKPKRKDPAVFGWQWWIYQEEDYYMQVAVEDQQVKGLYAIGKGLNIQPLEIGNSLEEIEKSYPIQQQLIFDQYRIELTEKDLENRPVILLNDQVVAQLYIAPSDDQLSGIRLMNQEMLALIRPYKLYYKGEITEIEEQKEWAAIETAEAQQIFDITNFIRSESGLNELNWNDTIGKVAKRHSKEMKEEGYFSHYSINGENLADRLTNINVDYRSAGENIGVSFYDAPEMIHHWLNNEGQREALLKKEYTDLGVGVYRTHYTQKFLEKE
ncbi:CAP domain-containing protein [Gracilibacillus alcaliphilus]|uniref:CAP domain-containing protein n=1 Tax=Gracilibacillus alcaliphilus TaxID=1401441 RepID=UPI0019560D55|nr:CAP domain-containing protein [Gracilibacillus alcaliphilus]MBM7678645.1 uncharacterized protein YkwD [Gracilibacillus alcaliphilus]